MVIHQKVYEGVGAGKWDMNSTRYVPVGGGSRSRLPIADDSHQRRYTGFVGIDEHLTPDIFRIAQLYAYIGGAPVIPPGPQGKFTQLILSYVVERVDVMEAQKQAGGQ